MRDWADADAEILDLIWKKFEADGDWPNGKQLQRELFRAGKNFNVTEFGFGLPAALGRLDTLSGRIVLASRGLSFDRRRRDAWLATPEGQQWLPDRSITVT